MREVTFAMITCVLVLIGGLPGDASSQDARAREIIELNDRIMHQQILARDATLFQDVALEQFLVVAPDGRVEDKTMAAAGVGTFDAAGIDIRDQQVTCEGDTAVLVGRIEIDGVMKPVGAMSAIARIRTGIR